VFFGVVDTQCPTVPSCIARARSDGTGYQLLPMIAASQPAPSPDGSRVAFSAGAGAVRVFDIGTSTVSTWSVAGLTPAWSPDGTRIAYRTNDGVSIVNADGSGDHVLTTLVAFAPLSWSPDSRWVIVPRGVGAALVDASTGSVVPLAYFITAAPGGMK
jgi:Tol biopolymer transport system component